jgi:hypothetical protein
MREFPSGPEEINFLTKRPDIWVQLFLHVLPKIIPCQAGRTIYVCKPLCNAAGGPEDKRDVQVIFASV